MTWQALSICPYHVPSHGNRGSYRKTEPLIGSSIDALDFSEYQGLRLDHFTAQRKQVSRIMLSGVIDENGADTVEK
jgi:hypothetical protein